MKIYFWTFFLISRLHLSSKNEFQLINEYFEVFNVFQKECFWTVKGRKIFKYCVFQKFRAMKSATLNCKIDIQLV